jgi:undecaprenyl pyrophosphate synthase
MLCSSFHPYFVSTTEINYNNPGKTVEITCRLFTDNLEDALKKIYKKEVDLLHPKDKKEVEKLLLDYISKRLKITSNGQSYPMEIIGYEKEEDAIWTYLEIKKDILPKTVTVENGLLYDFLPKQINMVHVTVNGANRQSSKVENPDKKMNFTF